MPNNTLLTETHKKVLEIESSLQIPPDPAMVLVVDEGYRRMTQARTLRAVCFIKERSFR